MRIARLAALAPAFLLATGCLFDDGSDSKSDASGSVFALGTQYSSEGGTAALDRVDTAASLLKSWSSSDVVTDTAGGALYVLQRSTGAVTGFADGDLSQVVVDVNVGASANPYAVAKVGNKLWVACYGSAWLKAVDLSTGALADSVDLSAYAYTGQTLPYATFVRPWNGKLVVVLGRLAGWSPGDSSLVVVVDPTSKTVTKSIVLPFKNAYGHMEISGDKLLVPCVGAWTTDDYTALELDGGVAVVDLAAGTATTLATEATLSGSAVGAGFGPDGAYLVSVSDAAYANALFQVSAAGVVGSKVSGGADVGAFAWDGANLWVGASSSTAPALVKLSAGFAPLDTVATTLSITSLAVLP